LLWEAWRDQNPAGNTCSKPSSLPSFFFKITTKKTLKNNPATNSPKESSTEAPKNHKRRGSNTKIDQNDTNEREEDPAKNEERELQKKT